MKRIKMQPQQHFISRLAFFFLLSLQVNFYFANAFGTVSLYTMNTVVVVMHGPLMIFYLEWFIFRHSLASTFDSILFRSVCSVHFRFGSFPFNLPLYDTIGSHDFTLRFCVNALILKICNVCIKRYPCIFFVAFSMNTREKKVKIFVESMTNWMKCKAKLQHRLISVRRIKVFILPHSFYCCLRVCCVYFVFVLHHFVNELVWHVSFFLLIDGVQPKWNRYENSWMIRLYIPIDGDSVLSMVISFSAPTSSTVMVHLRPENECKPNTPNGITLC